jgi:3-hydroxyisobutyrate dehydrogenase
MKAGFIGLGRLGRAMARRLIEEEVELVVWNRTPEKAQGLGAEVAKSPAEVFEKARFVFLCLFDSGAVREVLSGRDGFTSRRYPEERIIIDTTTNHFEAAEAFHELVGEHGSRYLESPVLGSVAPASKGALTVLVSGDEEAYEKARILLEKIGKTVFYLGTPGLAARMKLINNLVLGSLMASIAEALAFAEEAGLGKEKALDVLGAGAGNSLVLSAKRDKLLKEDFSAHFSSALMYKDLHLLQELAWSMKRPLHTAAAVKELFAMTYPAGLAEEDFSAVYRLFRK